MTSLTMHKRRFPRGEKAYSCSGELLGSLETFGQVSHPTLFHVDTKHLLIVIGQETCSAITRGMPRGIGKMRKRRRWREKERGDARKEPRLICIFGGRSDLESSDQVSHGLLSRYVT